MSTIASPASPGCASAQRRAHVEPLERLVARRYRGSMQDRRDERHLLAHAVREAAHRLVGAAFQSETRGEIEGAGARVPGIQSAHAGEEGEIFFGRELL